MPDEELTLSQLVEANITDYWAAIETVSVKAEKEFRLEKSLAAMKEEWREFEFEVKPYKETGAFVVAPS